MKSFIKENKMFLLIIVVAFIVAIAVIGGRINVERNNKSFDVVLDYNEMAELASQSKHDTTWWFEQFKDMGITKVGLAEENLVTLMDNKDAKVSAEIMATVMKDANWQENYPKALVDKMYQHGYDKYDVLVKAASPEDYQFIQSAMTARYSSKKYFCEPVENGGYIILNGTPKETLYKEKYRLITSTKKGFTEVSEIDRSQLMYLNLGMMQSKVDILNGAGMEIVPRTASYEGWNDTKYAKAIIAEYEKMGIHSPYMIVGGEAVMGYDDGIETIQNYIEKNDITMGLIENTTQLQNILQSGVEDIVKQSDYKAVRIFSVWDYIQNRYQYYGYQGAEEIENTLFRAVVERNVRLVYFKPIKEYKDQQVYVTNIEEYKTLFSNLDRRLAEHNLEFGQASIMHNYHVPMLAKFFMALGCAAAALLLLKTILPMRRRPERILGALAGLAVIGAVLVMPSHVDFLSSLSAAVLFPCLAVIFITKQSLECSNNLESDTKLTKIIPLAIGTLIVGVVISLIGGMLTAAPISSISYMLEIDIFRGVKAAQLLPIAFFALVYLAYYGFGKEKKTTGKLEIHDLKNIMDTSIKVWMIILGAVLAVVGWYYISRTGHDTGVEVSNAEMIFRNALEDHLLARPRNKEFLFAFPAVMMMVYTSIRGFKLWPILFGLASVIGMTSVTNTFMHIRTPLYLGLVRTGYSLLFGIVVGIVAIIAFELLFKLYKKIERQIV